MNGTACPRSSWLSQAINGIKEEGNVCLFCLAVPLFPNFKYLI